MTLFSWFLQLQKKEHIPSFIAAMALRLFFYTFSLTLPIIHAANVLDRVRNDPQLSTFASIIAKTGNGIPNPGTAQPDHVTCYAQSNM